MKSSIGDKIGRILARQSHKTDRRKLKHLANLVGRSNRIANKQPLLSFRSGFTVLGSRTHILRKA